MGKITERAQKGYATKGNKEQRSSARRPPAARQGRASGPRFPKVCGVQCPVTPCTPASRDAAQNTIFAALAGLSAPLALNVISFLSTFQNFLLL